LEPVAEFLEFLEDKTINPTKYITHVSPRWVKIFKKLHLLYRIICSLSIRSYFNPFVTRAE
jgi:hypothetical protein